MTVGHNSSGCTLLTLLHRWILSVLFHRVRPTCISAVADHPVHSSRSPVSAWVVCRRITASWDSRLTTCPKAHRVSPGIDARSATGYGRLPTIAARSSAHELIQAVCPLGPTGIVAGNAATDLCWSTHARIARLFEVVCYVLSGMASAATAEEAVSVTARTLVVRNVW